MGTVPGSEFYYERLARARAVPEAERSADVQQWLRVHEELEAALAALPEVPADASPQRPLVEPLGGDAALAALLRFIAAAYADSARDPVHPKATLFRLAPQLPPFFRVCRNASDQAGASSSFFAQAVMQHERTVRPRLQNQASPQGAMLSCCPQVPMAPQPALMETLGWGGLAADEADLAALARLMLLAHVSQALGHPTLGHLNIRLELPDTARLLGPCCLSR